MSNRAGRRVFATLMLATAAAGLPLVSAQAYQYKLLYSFTGGTDGGYPLASLVGDEQGNFYGTAQQGGSACSYCGTVFKINAAGTETVLHAFAGGATDGYWPYAGLIRDSSGNLYGTTTSGGAGSYGTVFKVSSDGTETILYSFLDDSTGFQPRAGVIFDAKGNLYGTTYLGGPDNCGTVFKLKPDGTEKVLYSFAGCRGAADGANPASDLVMDSAGNLYGTTTYSGYSYGRATSPSSGDSCSIGGTIFELTSTGTESTLYCFGGRSNPAAGLTIDNSGNMYGTDPYASSILEISGGNVSVLYRFSGGQGGANPFTALRNGHNGGLLGMTASGGADGDGVVFRLAPSGREHVIYSLTSGNNGEYASQGPLASDAAGNLYGTTVDGGANGVGGVFELMK